MISSDTKMKWYDERQNFHEMPARRYWRMEHKRLKQILYTCEGYKITSMAFGEITEMFFTTIIKLFKHCSLIWSFVQLKLWEVLYSSSLFQDLTLPYHKSSEAIYDQTGQSHHLQKICFYMFYKRFYLFTFL